MVRCPTCSRAFDPGTERCPIDGAALVAGLDVGPGFQRTIALPGASSSPFVRVSGASPAAAVVAGTDVALGELATGLVVGEFEIRGKIGQGGMAVVYLGVHTVIGKRAAIKVLNPEYARDPAAVSRFVQEARAVNQIGHRNIIDIFQLGQLPDGRSFLVMELLQGRSLKAHLHERGALPLAEVLAIVVPICDALGAAHAAGIVHRDLKPDNLFLEEEQGPGALSVKVLDFGIAKLMSLDAASPTQSGTIVGTPHYMAPEQLRTGAVDARADVYSLGVVLYELLTGRVPHDAETIYSLIANKLHTRPPRPSSLVRLPRELDALVLRCLELDADRRPSSMSEIQASLLRIAQAEGISLQTASTSVPIALPPAPPARRRRLGPLLAVAAGLGLGGVVVLATSRSRPPEPVVVQPVEVPPPPKTAAGRAATEIAAPQTGALEVHTNVARATFELDGRTVGDASRSMSLGGVTPGAHMLRVMAADHRPWSATVEIKSGQRTVRQVELEDRPRAQRPKARRNARDLPDPFAN